MFFVAWLLVMYYISIKARISNARDHALLRWANECNTFIAHISNDYSSIDALEALSGSLNRRLDEDWEGMVHHMNQAAQNVQPYNLKVQMELEQAFMDIAYLTGEPSVVICDRGTVDAAVYLKDYEWTEIMETMWWSDEFISHNRYDLVLHLVTAAIGAEAFYTTENNEARTETLEEARALDHKFREVWADHPNRLIIDNEGNFEDKLEQMWEGLQVLLQSQDDE
jgi:hypothetical protein